MCYVLCSQFSLYQGKPVLKHHKTSTFLMLGKIMYDLDTLALSATKLEIKIINIEMKYFLASTYFCLVLCCVDV